jgi:hypothetical protein
MASPTPKSDTTAEPSLTHTGQIKKALDGVLRPDGAANVLKAIAKTRGYPCAFRAPSDGQLIIDWHARFKHRKTLIASGSLTTDTAGSYRAILKLTAAGKKLVESGRTVKITTTATFTKTGGEPISATKSWMLG